MKHIIALLGVVIGAFLGLCLFAFIVVCVVKVEMGIPSKLLLLAGFAVFFLWTAIFLQPIIKSLPIIQRYTRLTFISVEMNRLDSEDKTPALTRLREDLHAENFDPFSGVAYTEFGATAFSWIVIACIILLSAGVVFYSWEFIIKGYMLFEDFVNAST